MPISKQQARELARAFRALSIALGEYRFANWDTLGPAKRREIEDAEWTLLNYSSDFTTTAVGIALADMKKDMALIEAATAKAAKVVATITAVKDILTVAAGLIVLGGAIASQSPSAVASAAGDLFNTAKSIIDRQKK